MKHTPEPWTLDGENIKAGDKCIASVYDDERGILMICSHLLEDM